MKDLLIITFCVTVAALALASAVLKLFGVFP